MATEITMPAVSPSMTEGTLARWLKAEGEPVAAGEVVAEIETDKALVEIEAECDGVFGRPLVEEGTTGIAVGTVIATILRPGESPGLRTTSPRPLGEATQTAVGKEPSPAAVTSAAATFVKPEDFRVLASPLARRLAHAHDLDLTLISGTGPNGRIVRRDVDLALKVDTRAQSAPKPAKSASATTTPVPILAPDEYEEVAHSAMRRIIAQRLSESKQQVPHFYLTIDCRLDKLLALRQEINRFADGAKISVNDFVVKAVAAAVRRVPAVNASWTDTAVRRYRTIDVCVAVATPTGLVTPVVRNADAKGLRGISDEIRDLADRARKSRLLPYEYQGGGISISNLGMYGIREFAAIINPPQSCILAVGAGEPRAIAVDGAVAIATIMTCTLSVDHRVVDGATAAEFLAAFRGFVENPALLLVH